MRRAAGSSPGAARRAARIWASLKRGIFPHDFAFFLDLPWRHLVLPPRTLANRLPLPARRVLEVGAGTGFYAVEIARAMPQGWLELLDLQPEMLAHARRKIEAAGLRNVGFTEAEAGRLPFGDGAFEVVYLVTVLGEIGDPDAFMGEAHRVLAPGGTLSVSEHVPDPDRLPIARVQRLAEARGFVLREHFGSRWSYTANFTRG
ncbi:MAG TPA: methyltransferase domain-containing protein [Longimicrobium sp.]|jgi:ubiquinone/menaquinone biosynthesis C-methylase UbiE